MNVLLLQQEVTLIKKYELINERLIGKMKISFNCPLLYSINVIGYGSCQLKLILVYVIDLLVTGDAQHQSSYVLSGIDAQPI